MGGARRWPALLACAALAVVLSGCGGTNTAGGGGSSPPAGTGTPVIGGLTGTYPTPQEETFQSCPPQGDGGDTNLNLLKNRIDTGAWQPTTVGDLLALGWPAGVEKARRSTWSSADAAQIARSEGRPVVVEGTLLMVRHEGPESPNCHDAGQRDFHMWLAAAPGDSRANAVIVEVTPRVRAQHAGWQPDRQLLGLAGHHVRVSGWLLMDQEHPEQLHKTRGTLWEVHPVMKIEVDQGGGWVDLDGGTIQLQPLRGVPRGTGSVGGSHRRRRRSRRS